MTPAQTTKSLRDIFGSYASLFTEKSRTYGSQTDPLACVRAAEDFGTEGWRYALLRMNEKLTRLKTAATSGDLDPEMAEEELRDIGVFTGIAIHFIREEE